MLKPNDVVTLRRELDVTIEGFHLDCRDCVTQLVLVEAVGCLECLLEDIDGCRSLSGLVRDRSVGRIVGLEAGIPVSSRTEHRVGLRQGLNPLCRAQEAVGGLRELFLDLGSFTVCQCDHRHIDLHLVDLTGRGSRALRVAGDDQGVRLQRLHLGQRGRHVGQVGRQLVVDDMTFMPYSLILSITPARTSIENGSPSNARAIRTPLRVGRLGSCEVDRGGEILLGCRQHCEQILVALGEERARCALCLDHRDAELFRHRRNRLGHARAVRPKHIFDAILLDQALGKLRATGRR